MFDDPIETVRTWYKDVDNLDAWFSAHHLQEKLISAGLGFGVLDPTGKTSDADMEAQFREKVRQRKEAQKPGAIAKVREWYENIADLDSYFSTGMIREQLQSVGLGLGILDRGGKTSDADMEIQFREKVRQRDIAEVRREFGNFDTDSRDSISSFERKLKFLRVGYEVLDPTGKKSHDEMVPKVQAKIKAMFIRKARWWYKIVDTNERPKICLKNAFTALERVGADITALDPEGKKTKGEMERDIKVKMLKANERTNIEALENLHELIESGFLESGLGGGHVVSDKTADNVREAIEYQRATRFFPDDKDAGSKPSAPASGKKTKRWISRRDLN